MKNLILSLSFILFLISCGEKEIGFKLSGRMIDAPNKVVELNRVSLQGQKSLVSSTNTDERGNFELTTETPIEEAIYQLSIGNKKVSFVLNGEDTDIQITGKFQTFDQYDFDVTGSALTGTQVLSYNNIVTKKWPEVMVLDYLNNLDHSLVAIQTGIAFFMKTPEDYKYVRNLANKVDADLGGTAYGREFKEFIAFYDQKVKENTTIVSQGGGLLNIGDPAPEIALPNPDGKVMKLSDLKGKVVLIDFWASWCGPCRRANPHVVSIYNKYKDQGFTVYSVSLDRNGQKDRWVAAIEQDNLTWENHVSDLKFWQSEAARRYGVRAIPATFLLDRDGIIRKMNPRGNLESAIQELL